jgi:hypothetical protein
MSSQLEQIAEHVRPFLHDGEELVAAMTGAPRGRNTAMAAGGVGSMIGHKMTSDQVARGRAVGLAVASNMALVLTEQRLLSVKVTYSMGGAITGVIEILSELPIEDVESIQAKRFGLGGVLAVTARGGQPVKLECRAGRAKEFAEAFNLTASRS